MNIYIVVYFRRIIPDFERFYSPKNIALYITEVQAAGSTYGNYFRVTTYGESHGGGVGCVVDGCPPRLSLCEEDLQVDLDRR